MPLYRAPLEDYRFVLFDLLDLDGQRDLPGFSELSPSLVDEILATAARFCEEVLQPLNRSGDEEGAHFDNGTVTTPKGFKEAYQAYCDSGWGGMAAESDVGGAGMPFLIALVVSEMAHSANQSFAMYPGLTAAAAAALGVTGAPWMKAHVLPKLVSGEWCGTMCLTEPHCGTDLRLMKTRAVEQADGTYRMSGTKIFISGGDHDLTPNIIHMVIAKIPDANGQIHDDLSTVNFFMVPKFLVSEDGKMGARNAVTTGGIEKKMGIKAQATCVLNFDEAVAFRLGPKPGAGAGEGGRSSAGMAGMFTMMNLARLGVGVQGVSIGEVAYQNGYAYAHERRAMRALTSPAEPDKAADLLIVQPDVRRMLLHSRASIQGVRALAFWTALQSAIAMSGREEAEGAGLLADLMTPVIKAFGTDVGFEVANMAMQIWGGHGYIRENGMEQFVRDGRINQIYEGANGVQALDLVGRKLRRKGGAGAMLLLKTITGWIDDAAKAESMRAYIDPLKEGLEVLQTATLWLASHGPQNPNDAGAASVPFLRLVGIVVVGWMWARMAKIAQDKLASSEGNAEFYQAKLVSARYWMEHMMPECALLYTRIAAGSDTIMAFA